MIATTGQIGHVHSWDGTRIGYRRGGEGSPLVLVHGGTADHTRWLSILPALEERFTVYAVDRRGRGLSGDAPDYAIEREFEDVAAVVEGIGGPVDVLGHSYGALCALEAALRTTKIRRLALYEPPVSTGREMFPRAAVERVDALLAAGDRDAALVAFFRGVLNMPEQELELLRAHPSWQARVAFAHTISRELRAAEAYRFKPGRFAALRTPTLLLMGSESLAFLTDATAAVHAALPDSRLGVMKGQQHIAMTTAPDLFLGTLLPFLSAI